MRNLLAAAVLLLLAGAGCAQLPEGEAPSGAIVRQPSTEQAVTAAEATEALTTHLVAASLAEFPGAELCCEADPESAAMLFAAVREAGRVSGITAVRSLRPWRLAGRSGTSFWEFSLFHGERLVWRRTFWSKE